MITADLAAHLRKIKVATQADWDEFLNDLLSKPYPGNGEKNSGTVHQNG